MAIIEELARYLTGPSVGFHSISLNMDGAHRAAAKEFFKLRAELGVSGYDSYQDAVENIQRRLGVSPKDSSGKKEEV